MNRLAAESSPYLRQHADNPVDWYPWGEEAFAKAAAEDKPVLLSIGYSACHWCHVMAHESFEDETVAKLMNDSFVNIKVDREERPDVDAVYMEATQAMTGQGGWPMTVFMLPNGQPFFAGTYFGKQSMPGHPSFVQVIDAVTNGWGEQREQITEQAEQLRNAIEARTSAFATDIAAVDKGQTWIQDACASIASAHDRDWGGFSPAPKFPQSSLIDLLLRSRNDEYLPAIKNTLDAMASGGMYDHMGGGFHRYSVDAFWMVPHFEKMLYDQATLARTYTDAYLVTGEERYKQVATEVIEYVLCDLTAAEGAFYSAEDADSEGEEGLFYVWRPEAIDKAIGDIDISSAVRRWYGVTGAGNFEGSNILHRPERGDLIRSETVEEGRRRLFAARQERERPGLDDKVLTEWNAMFIATLAQASGALQREDWLQAAIKAVEFLLDNLQTQSGRWQRAWHQKSGAQHLAFASDYAWLVEAFTRLGEATGERRWRDLSVATADQMIELFWDDKDGGLFTTGSDAEALIVRAKDLFEDATPSANSTGALALARLALLSGRNDLRERALTLISLVAEPAANHGSAFPYLLGAVDLLSAPSTEVVVAGDHPNLVEALRTTFLPRAVISWGKPDDSPLWDSRTDGAYVCHNFACDLPVTTVKDLREQLA